MCKSETQNYKNKVYTCTPKPLRLLIFKGAGFSYPQIRLATTHSMTAERNCDAGKDSLQNSNERHGSTQTLLKKIGDYSIRMTYRQYNGGTLGKATLTKLV